MPKVAVMIQKRWRGYLTREHLARQALALLVQKLWRGMQARKYYKFNEAASQIQRIFRGFKERKFVKLHRAALLAQRDLMRKHAAARKLQKFVRRRLDRHYLLKIKAHYQPGQPVPKIANWNSWPRAFTTASRDATPGLKKMHRAYWAQKKIATLNEDQKLAMKQKILALCLFQPTGKPWDCGRKWTGDYCGVASNPYLDKFKKAVQIMFQKFGDSQINFADTVTKVDKKGKVDPSVLIVTDKHIFKYFAKSFKLNKVGVPLSAVKQVMVSVYKDTYAVVKVDPPYRDIVVNLGTQTETEKLSEFVTILTEEGIPVVFLKEIPYNNSRGPTLKNAGKEVKMVFVQKAVHTPGSDFKLVGQVATVSYPDSVPYERHAGAEGKHTETKNTETKH